MLYYLSQLSEVPDWLSPVRLFQYVTFRAAGAAITAFLLTACFGGTAVRLLTRLQITAPDHLEGVIADDKRDLSKRHVPTMGGVLILPVIVVTILLWAIPSNSLVLIFIQLLVCLGLVGYVDDRMKVAGASSNGMPGRVKLALQVVIGLAAVWLLDQVPETSGHMRSLMVPFLKTPVIEDMGIWLCVMFGCIVVVSASNAVNLTDGLDGLAIGCIIICASAYAVFAYFCGHSGFAEYLQIPFIPGSSEVVVIAIAIAGAGLGFLWHNCPPATMYMGDTGSISIGGAIGLIAVLVKQELLLLVVGGVFVIEAASVILQVGYFKLSRRLTGTPRRLFRCSPIHHHFQELGWPESKIVIRFWIVALVLAALALATLKVR